MWTNVTSYTHALLRIHVTGGQRLVWIAPPSMRPHHSGPATRDFQSSILVEVLLWGCHLDVQGLLHQQLLSSAMVQHCGLLPVDRMVFTVEWEEDGTLHRLVQWTLQLNSCKSWWGQKVLVIPPPPRVKTTQNLDNDPNSGQWPILGLDYEKSVVKVGPMAKVRVRVRARVRVRVSDEVEVFQ